MKISKVGKLTLFLASAGVAFAMPCETTRAAPPAPAVTPLHISVSGISHGYTNGDLRALITRGVAAALADDRAPSTTWSFVVQTAPGNRPATEIVATLQVGDQHVVSGFFTSPTLGTAPTSLFVEEVSEFAKRLLRRSET